MNEVICHGTIFPSPSSPAFFQLRTVSSFPGIPDARPLEDGDIINLDISLYHKGFHSDLNATYPIGNVSPTNLALIKATRECLDEAIRVCKPGYLFRDVGEVIEATAKKRGFTVNKTYNGHGVNQYVTELGAKIVTITHLRLVVALGFSTLHPSFLFVLLPR